NTIGQAWFPYFVSILRERFGSYAIALEAVFAVSVIGALAILLLPRHQAQDETFRLQNSGRIAAGGWGGRRGARPVHRQPGGSQARAGAARARGRAHGGELHRHPAHGGLRRHARWESWRADLA